MKNLLKNIGYAVICIIVAPAAVIHIAYRTWYFRHFVIGPASRKGSGQAKPSKSPEPSR